MSPHRSRREQRMCITARVCVGVASAQPAIHIGRPSRIPSNSHAHPPPPPVGSSCARRRDRRDRRDPPSSPRSIRRRDFPPPARLLPLRRRLRLRCRRCFPPATGGSSRTLFAVYFSPVNGLTIVTVGAAYNGLTIDSTPSSSPPPPPTLPPPPPTAPGRGD